MDVAILALDSVSDTALAYAVVGARCDGQWIFVRHRERDTWEMPGGHREPGESIDQTARRELFEETGAVAASMIPVCDYSVLRNGELSYGRLYLGHIKARGALPDFEIAEIMLGRTPPGPLTYPEIQPLLMEELDIVMRP